MCKNLDSCSQKNLSVFRYRTRKAVYCELCGIYKIIVKKLIIRRYLRLAHVTYQLSVKTF